MRITKKPATTTTNTRRSPIGGDGGESLLFKIKFLLMGFLLALDIGLNSSAEHDTIRIYEDEQEHQDSKSTILALILGFQLVVQVGVFASLFVIMFETYPFRVGLMGMLTSKYLAVYAINMVYILMTASVYGYRVTCMIQDPEMGIWEVWDIKGYLLLSILHKIVATYYYVTNIRAALLLGDPIFYSKHAWVRMYSDRGGNLDGDVGVGAKRSATVCTG